MNEGLGRGYEDLWDCELKSMAKSLSVVELLGPNAENAFMVEHPGGARHFYDAEGILLANLSAQWKLHEVLGEFDTWDEFEELAGISVGIFYDACPTCKRQ